jgi:hypothetical protein
VALAVAQGLLIATTSHVAAQASATAEGDCLMDISRVREIGQKHAPDLFVEPAPDSSTASYFAILVDATLTPVEVARGPLRQDRAVSAYEVALLAFPHLGNDRRIRCTSSRSTRLPKNKSSSPNGSVWTVVVLPK